MEQLYVQAYSFEESSDKPYDNLQVFRTAAEIVKRYSGRIRLIHVKESDKVIGPQPPMKGRMPREGPILRNNSLRICREAKN